MRIKEVSKMTGLTERTIRYYESCGLVIPNMEMKDHRVWRDYSEEHARLLAAVGTLRRASFQVEEIAQLLSAPEKIPETVKRVRERVEATKAEAEKLCERLGQPDLREAADVPDLARRLEDVASGFELPPADRSFRTRGMDRYYREPRSLSVSLAAQIGALVCVLWLLSMVLLTCFYARDLGHQASAECEKTLEAFFDEPEHMEAASLPEVRFSPNDGFLTFDKVGFALPQGVLVLDEYGVVTENDGFWMSQAIRVDYDEHRVTAEDVEHEELWLAVAEGKLCFMVDPVRLNGEVWLTDLNNGSCYRGVLTFRDAPHRGGSFFSGDADWYLPTLELDYSNSPQVGTFWVGTFHTTGRPARPSRYKTGEKFEDGRVVPLGDEYSPPLELLDGIESGKFRFDADGILMGSCLRGAWQRDGEGEPIRFLLAAYGWSPLTMAVRLLPGAYLVSLAVFLLLGFASGWPCAAAWYDP